MIWNILLWMTPVVLVLLVGLGLSLWNFYRHGRSARIALAGYLLILFWAGSHTAALLLVTVVRKSPSWNKAAVVAWDADYYTQFLAPLLGYALLTWAVFAGRQLKTRSGGPA